MNADFFRRLNTERKLAAIDRQSHHAEGRGDIDHVLEGFAEVPYEPSDPETPSPCGTDSVPKAYPDALRTGVELDKGNELQLIEGVSSGEVQLDVGFGVEQEPLDGRLTALSMLLAVLWRREIKRGTVS